MPRIFFNNYSAITNEMVLLDIYIICIDQTYFYLDHSTGTHQTRISISPSLHCPLFLFLPLPPISMLWHPNKHLHGLEFFHVQHCLRGKGESPFSVLYHQNGCYQKFVLGIEIFSVLFSKIVAVYIYLTNIRQKK